MESGTAKGVSVSGEISIQTSKTWQDTGFCIMNNSDSDLDDCTIRLLSIDGNTKTRIMFDDYALWGEDSEHRGSREMISTLIQHGANRSVYLNQTHGEVKRITGEHCAGMHEMEFLFHANAKDGKGIGMNIYCIVECGDTEVGGFTTQRLLLRKVGT
jgi:hypothetical protein